MTARSSPGSLYSNSAFAVAGITVLWAFRGFRSWSDVARLAGLGYLVGVAAFGALWTLLLVVDIPFGGVAIVTLAGDAQVPPARARRNAVGGRPADGRPR